MVDLQIMESFKPPDHLYEEFPNVLLVEEGGSLAVLHDPLVHIASVRVLHDDTQRLSGFFKERLLVRNNVRMSRSHGETRFKL